jgi:CRISPR-associated protein Csm4
VPEYECYRLSIGLKSPVGTPWQADTVIGHLAWMVAFNEGLKGVEEFLAPFITGNPPFIVSDGFPGGLLPRPLGIRQMTGINDLASYTRERSKRKAEFLEIGDFEKARRGKEIEGEPLPSPWEGFETLHAAISRKSNTTTGEAGNLFSTESWVIRAEDQDDEVSTINVYSYCLKSWREKVERLFQQLSMMGFGRDKSVGSGHFNLLKMEEWKGFGSFDGANGFIVLSSFVPAEDDPVNGRWALNIKYGKLGENVAYGNPFKRPFLQIKPGGTFYTGAPPKAYYGRVLKDLAPGFPEAIQICYTLAIPCKI